MLFSRMRHGGMACINSKISEGVLYKDMVYNKILKKETFEIFLAQTYLAGQTSIRLSS